MASKFPNVVISGNCNILQPKHLNTSSLNIPEHGFKVVQPTNSVASAGNFLSLTSGFIQNDSLGLRELSVFNETLECGNGLSNTRKGPNTMAKRNARERNRVKLVNQGFQTLRQHIPDDYRVKKMSKVDILRCALYYIRSLEQKLQIPTLPEHLMSSLEGPLSGGNSGDVYDFGEGVSFRQHASYDQHVSSLSKSTSSEVGDEGDSSFSFSDEEDLPKESMKKQRVALARDRSPSSGMCSLSGRKDEQDDSSGYHYKEDSSRNKSSVKPEIYKSQIFMMVGGGTSKITHSSVDTHYLSAEDLNPSGSQSIKEELDNNDENYHSQSDWSDKLEL